MSGCVVADQKSHERTWRALDSVKPKLQIILITINLIIIIKKVVRNPTTLALIIIIIIKEKKQKKASNKFI
jgi:hypothetical protein